MKIVPLFDNVVLQKIKQQQTSSILLPQTEQEKPDMAKVIAVGEGGFIDNQQIKMVLSVNDQVLFNKFAGAEFNLNGETYILIKQTDVLAIVKN